MTSSSALSPSIIDHSAVLEDPRIEGKVQHKLLDMLVIAISGVICNANDWVTIAQFGRAKENWFRTFLELLCGIPSHDTFSRLFSLLDPDVFSQCFQSWMAAMNQRLSGIENKLHWVLDVTFSKDSSRVRKGHGTENLSRLRHLALNILNSDQHKPKLGVKHKRLTAGWDNDYLARLLS